MYVLVVEDLASLNYLVNHTEMIREKSKQWIDKWRLHTSRNKYLESLAIRIGRDFKPPGFVSTILENPTVAAVLPNSTSLEYKLYGYSDMRIKPV